MRDATSNTQHRRISCAASSGQRTTSSMREALYSTTSAQHGRRHTQDATYDRCRSMQQTHAEPAPRSRQSNARDETNGSRTLAHLGAAPGSVLAFQHTRLQLKSNGGRASRRGGAGECAHAYDHEGWEGRPRHQRLRPRRVHSTGSRTYLRWTAQARLRLRARRGHVLQRVQGLRRVRPRRAVRRAVFWPLCQRTPPTTACSSAASGRSTQTCSPTAPASTTTWPARRTTRACLR